jgi:hypothetical protein
MLGKNDERAVVEAHDSHRIAPLPRAVTYAHVGDFKTFTISNAIERELTVSRVLEYLTKGKLIPFLRQAVIEDQTEWESNITEVLEEYVRTLRGKVGPEKWLADQSALVI